MTRTDLRSHAVRLLLHRAADYRRLIPEWPALAQSLEDEALAMRDGIKPNPPQPRKTIK